MSPSNNVRHMIEIHAQKHDETRGEELYMTTDDFVEAAANLVGSNDLPAAMTQDSLTSVRISTSYQVLRRIDANRHHSATVELEPRIYLEHFCLFSVYHGPTRPRS